jgi:rare lipoprotein A
MCAALVFVISLVVVFWASTSQAQQRVKTAMLSAPAEAAATSLAKAYQQGLAAWYQVGKRTANGETFNPNGMTAAHRTLPFGTHVKVIHEKTGGSVVVRINDRGPFTRRHLIDLSRGAARALDIKGVARVGLYLMN